MQKSKLQKRDVAKGMSLLKNHDYERALIAFNKSYDKTPCLEALFGAAASHRALGDILGAVKKLKAAQEFDPSSFNASYNLGIAFFEALDYDNAIIELNAALEINNKSEKALNLLGKCYEKLSAFNLAEKCFKDSISISDSVENILNLSRLYKETGRSIEALNLLEPLKQSKNVDPVVLRVYANNLMEIDHHSLAVPIFKDLLKRDNSDIFTIFNLGVCYSQMGEKELAIRQIVEVISANPRFTEAYPVLINLLSSAEKVNYEHKVADLLQSTNLHDLEKASLHFSLGQIYEADFRFEESYDCYVAGNEIINSHRQYSKTKEMREKNKTLSYFSQINTFDQDTISTSHPREPDQTNIFIVGMPRSGSTLLEQILTSHPNCYGAGEIQFLPHSVSEAKELRATPKIYFEKIRDNYLVKLSELNIRGTHLIDKNLGNVKYAGHAMSSLENAKVIYIKRDPMAVCWSIFKRYFPNIHSLTYAYSFETIAYQYAITEQYAQFWKKKFPKQFIEVDYEKLVTETETTLSLLFQKLEMNWDQQFLNYHKMNTKAVRTASSNQVRNGIYRGSSRDWEKFGEFLEPLKSELTKYKLA